jgi:uncharacterized protein (UPF0305 family)
MIINELEKNVQTTGNFPTSSFRIAATAKAFQILSSNIYTYKVRAVIREISCNAADAHVAASNPDNFDVHLPTMLEPWFSVRDYGTGLSEQDIREIFTTYFSSTKTHSNEFTGALGLGSKSPFCLVDSFTVTSYYQGEKKAYSCYKDASGEPQIALLTAEANDGPNGLEVLVPGVGGRRGEFEQEAVEVFRYFDRVPNINIPDVVRRIEDAKSVYILQEPDFSFTQYPGNPKAVMGNVAYDIPNNARGSLGISGFIRFEIGELSFDPGRENLSLDDRTLSAIKAKVAKVQDALSQSALDSIEVEPTPFKRSLQYQKLMRGPLGSQLRDSSSEIGRKIREYRMPSTKDAMKVIYRTGRRAVIDYKHSVDFTEPNLFVCIDKPRMDRRMCHWTKETNSTIIALKESHVQELQIDPEFLKDTDTIPKMPYKRVVKTDGKASVAAMKWNGSINYLQNVDVLPSGEKVFITIHRKDIISRQWRISNENRLNNTLDKLAGVIEIPEIFVLKSAKMASVRFQKQKEKGEWIKLEDYIWREMLANVGTSIRTFDGDESVADFFRSIVNTAKNLGRNDSCLQEFRDFLVEYDAYNKYSHIHSLIEDFNRAMTNPIQLTLDTSLNDMRQTIFDKYPMLELVSYTQMRNEKNKISLLNYVLNQK